jgi:asparagine synthase (glutamine-hydrolysing)
MSGISGICNLDGQPADRELLRRMTAAMAHRGPDGIGYWVDGAVGLSHLMLHTTPESSQEKQPLLHQPSACCLTLDGRVDNRGELRAALASRGFAPGSDTDAELVLRAYECWGEDCARHIIGDFAFAIWDEPKRKLFCARDLVGIRPFYYTFDDRAFRFSSELRPLLDTPGFQRRLNKGMLAEYLCDRITSLEETLYQNILRLPPAHSLVLRDGRLRIARYFEFDPAKSVRYASDEEYAEHFFDIFKEAVSCRLRSQTPVALFLSGGLDSCSILGMAGYLANTGAIANSHLASYTLAFSHPEADERAYVSEATAMWGFAAHALNVDDLAPKSLIDDIQRYHDLPDAPNLSPWQDLGTMARQNGSRVNLGGLGGDEWLTGDQTHCADLLLRLCLPTLLGQIRHDVDIYRIWGGTTERFPIRQVLQWCLFPLIPQQLKSAVRRIVPHHPPPWIAPAFARRVNLQDRFTRRASPLRFPSLAQQGIHALLDSGYSALAKEADNRMEAHLAIEGRQPFHDRRLIEFALALPEEQRWHGDQTKYVLRQAMRGHIPDSIRQRKTKADFTCLTTEAFARENAEGVFETLRLAADGYVDGAAVRKMYDRYRHGDEEIGWPLWMIFAVELWLRNTSIMYSVDSQ